MTPLILALPGNEELAGNLVDLLPAERGEYLLREFPDHETYLRIESPVAGRDVVLVATLDRPNEKLVPLYLMASTLRSLQARNIVLVAPYLPYMRQDKVFRPGEGLSSTYIAHWISGFVDGLVTVEPHLHRVTRLDDIYSVPCECAQVSQMIAHWIDEHVSRPMIVGPDAESRQWSDAVARNLQCPGIVLHKLRSGDHQVEISIPDLPSDTGRTPVLVDDIVSTGQTMAAAIRRLRSAGYPQPVCVGVHALFDQATVDMLLSTGAERVVSCNTIRHATNAIDLSRSVMSATRALLRRLDPRHARAG